LRFTTVGRCNNTMSGEVLSFCPNANIAVIAIG